MPWEMGKQPISNLEARMPQVHEGASGSQQKDCSVVIEHH